jgi:hypothetical protein
MVNALRVVCDCRRRIGDFSASLPSGKEDTVLRAFYNDNFYLFIFDFLIFFVTGAACAS